MSGGEDWPVSCVAGDFSIDDNHSAKDFYQMSSVPFSANEVFPASAYNTLHRFAAPSEVRSDTDHSHRSVSTSSAAHEIQQSSDVRSPMGIIVHELAELNLRICRLTHSTSIWNLESLPSVNSPIINELFGLTNSLVSVFKKAEAISDSVSHQPWTETSDARNLKHMVLLEDGIALMVLSCHQQILSAFDKLYFSIYQHLITAQSSLAQPKFRAYNTPSQSPKLDSLECSSTAQSIMIVNLLEHLISCLDSAIAPIADFENLSPSWDSEMPDLLHDRAATQDVASGVDSSGPSSPMPSFTLVSPADGEETEADAVSSISRTFQTQVSPSYADITTVGAILDTMKRRRSRIDEHKRQLKVFLKSSTNL